MTLKALITHVEPVSGPATPPHLAWASRHTSPP
jgi:hypothetical protein